MGIYGMSRGFRITHILENHTYITPTSSLKKEDCLIGTRLTYGLMNGLFYSLPGWNLAALFRLFNRLDIKIFNRKREDYIKEYIEVRKEMNGQNLVCLATF
jgi:hypothetical protein